MSSFNKIKRWIRRQFLWRLEPCKQMVPLISQSLDRRLGINELLRMKVHLLVCVWCQRYLKQIRMIRNLLGLRDEGAGLVSEGLGDEARERIHRKIQNR